MALRGKKKADFLKRMAAGRRKAARARSGSSSRKKAPARRKKATTRRKAATRRKTSAAPARRRTRRKPEGVLSAMFKNAVPSVLGIVAAGTVARAIPAANTPTKRAAVTAGSAFALSMFAPFLARNVPLRIVTPTIIKAVAGGMFVDSVFRGSTTLRAKLDRLPTAAKRPGGLLAGRRAQPAYAGSMGGGSTSSAALAAAITRRG